MMLTMNTLALPLKSRGAPSLPLRMEIDRDIALADLPRAHTRTFVPKPLEEMKSIHHQMAHLLASGWKNKEVAEYFGRSESRISVLLSTPSFRQLVEDYRKDIIDGRREEAVAERNIFHRNMTLAADMLHERMEDQPDSFTNSQLLAIAADGADRVGLMKRSGSLSVNLDFADRLEAARRALGGPSLERNRGNS